MFLLICQRAINWPLKFIFKCLLVLGLGFGMAAAQAAAHTPPRVVSLTPHATELIFAAGAGDTIVATVSASDYPAQALRIDRIGDGLNTSAEQVLAWQPDWVMGWPSALMTQLQALGVNTLVLEAVSMTQIAQQIRDLGQLLGTQTVANTKSQTLEAAIAALGGVVGDGIAQAVSPPLPVVVLASADGQFVLGRHPLLNDALAQCGAHNLFAGARPVAPSVSLEGLLATNPSLVITGYAPPAWLADQFAVAIIDPDWLYRPGPRFIQAAQQICTEIKQVGQSKQ